MPIRVHFLCADNAALSQMAEALLRKLGGAAFAVHCAGPTAGALGWGITGKCGI